MPLISSGAYDRFSATASGPAATEYGLDDVQSFAVLREVTRPLQPVPLSFAATAEPVGLDLTEVHLTSGCRVMLRRVGDPELPLHVLAWWWDLGGGGPHVVGARDAADEPRWSLEVAADGTRTGTTELPLVPPRRLVGGVAVRVILWQTTPAVPAARITGEVEEAMRHTKLNGMLDLLRDRSGTSMHTVGLVREAATALGGEIAPVLRGLCTDYLDFYEGLYPVAELTAREWTVPGFHSGLRIRRTG
ncbi:hypothetical protein [Amycolatopsis sp. PS_44_ISF1]|uniref:hypothetical protein n=1 Tax=Amycolatopsis sp. PS_44_ISF1 TaxID=2974917 RepID=UPI0028E05CBC|nr:hypothetical protein [Amycolatopsis sp. PS_44_ISF1]MDT8912353.1 hypothetical protein [Amycolatopsis sp. PS_44_ISF1]